MRPIHKVRLDKVRPALLLTRELGLSFLHSITVAPITTMVYGMATEVPVGIDNGLDQPSAISCDNITTVGSDDVLDFIGFLHDADEPVLLEAIRAAFDLAV